MSRVLFGVVALATVGQAFYFYGQFIGTASIFVIVLLLFVYMLRRRESFAIDGHGRGVLITGCDSGFGHSLAKRLDGMGFAVFAGCLFPDGEGARNLVQECSRRMKVLKLDVTKDEDVASAKAVVQANLPEKGLWAVVNNAGISDWSETEWNTISDYYRMADVNLFGCIRTTLPFLPLVRASKGRLVFVSSIFAFFNCLTMGSYSVSKRGMEAFADCLRVEMASFDVKICIIRPGNFGPATKIVKEKTATEIWDKLDEDRKTMFNRRYIEIANEYYKSLCKEGSKDSSMVIEAMADAITSPRPKFRYLLTNKMDAVFFYAYPYLPTFVSDAVFSLSPFYHKRKSMLFSRKRSYS
ncbi:D-beta-hydroxybutyrate dehydrogenase, mitochondrial [Megalops cyprinoides]|uniref:D-beta-hydroxybutyrate dehydrogenase, mitochondrial n=1 Tax=Megalops cyprinoides TaxID=118141 RepID=UPI00186546C3|nr:D-beta-hydroxybutyrate dehydrogenase, mitochondrial [Megalops cyprinoides]